MDQTTKLKSLNARVSGLLALRADRKRRVGELEKEISNLKRDIDLNGKVEQVLQHISTKLLGQSTTTIDKLVTAGLKVIFEDLSFEFKTEVDRSRGKTAVKFKLLEEGREAPLMTSYGGGPLVVCGVLLRVVTIIVLGLNRILLLDESLSHLSAEYVENASRFLKKISEELDFTIVMVTHQAAFAQHADRHYEAKKGKAGTYFTEQRSGHVQGRSGNSKEQGS